MSLVGGVLSSYFSPIQDCDEVFNYWEPLHYLEHGLGFQTWEYAPQFGLRSYAYVLPLAFPLPKTIKFFVTRFLLAVVCWLCERYLVKTVNKFVSSAVGWYMAVFLTFSPGMFISAPALLPSSFAMNCFMVAFGLTLKPATLKRVVKYVLTMVLGITWGWPFLAFLGLIYLFHLLFQQNRLTVLLYLVQGTILTPLVIGPLLLIDYQFYQDLVFAPGNIVYYNLFSNTGGPELYGTEPWWFYIANGLLNFNIVFIAALASLPISLLAWLFKMQTNITRTSLLYFYGWFGLLSLQPHKEERFMYVIFPIICYNAGCALHILLQLVDLSARKLSSKIAFLKPLFQWGFMLVFCVLSLLRITSLVSHYAAPFQVYGELQNIHPPAALYENRLLNVCVGREWYRFPSHYFVPEGMRIGFLKTEFDGLLPKYYQQHPKDRQTLEQHLSFGDVASFENHLRHSKRTTDLIVENVNDRNQEAPDTHMSLEKCDYFIGTTDEPLSSHFKPFVCYPFLNSELTPTLSRAFYLGPKQWKEYCLFTTQ
ncbi:Alg9-like mannosyltransferase family-domain-containing protein [Gorgonomyces haynaldii]|nr:Alg9-like mannosyltransferase family-domain-containing protein [Gorgonomyces haynaldii]